MTLDADVLPLRDREPRPCPDGDEQRECELVGFRMKGEDLLQLRVFLTREDNEVCEVLTEQLPDAVHVRAGGSRSPWPDNL